MILLILYDIRFTGNVAVCWEWMKSFKNIWTDNEGDICSSSQRGGGHAEKKNAAGRGR